MCRAIPNPIEWTIFSYSAMIYPKDFIQYPSKRKLDDNTRNIRISTISYGISQKQLKKKIQTTKVNSSNVVDSDDSIFIRYLNNSTVHGFRYLNDPTIRRTERLTWCFLVLLALFGVIYVCYLLQVQFSTNILATVVETTFFPVFEIPYPAITICNNNRINWERVPSTIDFYLKNANNVTTSKLYDVIAGLNGFEFGSFDEFVKIKDMDVSDLDHIDLKELYKRIIHQCNEFFLEPCWWRNKYMNCCDDGRGLFIMQETEYGICYTFNSVLNSVGKSRSKNETDFPWRTSSFGDWSGLRVNIVLHDNSTIPNVKRSSGILVIIISIGNRVHILRKRWNGWVMANHPFSWPGTAYFVPKGTSTSVIIKPSYSYTTSDVQRLLPVDRKCLYPNELHKYQYETLPGTLYFRSNCLSECRQKQMVAHCNCTIDFLYPTAGYPTCNISNLKCLYNFDTLFNFERPPKGNPYFSDDEEGLSCDCLPECESIDYSFDVSPIQRISDDDADNTILIDFHFQQSTMVKYRTSVVFGWLDLMVAFGGIAGLFLGCSLISVAEMAFYLVIGITKLSWTRNGAVHQRFN